jgi:hypothetical protein
MPFPAYAFWRVQLGTWATCCRALLQAFQAVLLLLLLLMFGAPYKAGDSNSAAAKPRRNVQSAGMLFCSTTVC